MSRKALRKEVIEEGVCARLGCDRAVWCRGFCANHYEVERRQRRIQPLPKRGKGPCRYDGCSNSSTGWDWLCNKHRERERKGIYSDDQLRIRPRRACLERDELGRKFCIACEEWVPEDDFYRNSAGNMVDGLYARCKPCFNEQVKWTALRTKYGLSRTDVENMLAEQDYKCAICMKDFNPRYVVDHDHACCPGEKTCGKCVRSLLCDNCNLVLGRLNDDVELIGRFADYVMRHSREKR